MKLLPRFALLTITSVLGLQAQGIQRLEVTQVVQNVDQTVPLVAGKSTTVRVFPFVTAATEVRVTLRGRTDPAGSWSAIESGLQRVDPSEVGSRGTPSASVSFTLPDSWTVAGDLELDADLTVRDATTPVRLDQPLNVRFQNPRGLPRPLRIHYVRVCDPDCPQADFAPQLAQLLPIPDEQLIWDRYSDQYTSDPAALLREIGLLRAMSPAELMVVLRREPLFGTPVAIAPSLRLAVVATQGDGLANTLAGIVRLLGVPQNPRNLGSSDIGSNRFAPGLPNATWADLSDVPNTRNYWISSDSFVQLFNARPPIPAPLTAAAPTVFLTGTVRADGSTGALRPAFRVAFDIPPSAPDSTSTNCVRFFGSGTDPIASHCFQTLPAQLGLTAKPDDEPFALRLAYPEGTRRIALFKDTREIATLAVSPAAPTLDVIAGQNLRWTGADADGNLLTYRVLASGDGINWKPIGLELADTQLLVDLGAAPAGNPLQLQVLASDGVNTTAATARLQDPAREAKLELPVRDLRPPELLLGRSADLLAPVRNTGTGPLQITEVKSTHSAVRLVATRLPLEIPAGGQAQVQLRTQPVAAGQFASVVSFVSNDPAASALSIDVTGNGTGGVAPQVEASPFALNFGDVAPNSTRDLTLALRNRGNAPLTVSAIGVSNNTYRIVSPAPPFNVAPAGEQPVVMRFAPTAAGNFTGSLVLSTNDPARPSMIVPLSGTSTVSTGGGPVDPPPPPVGGVEVAPAQLDFGDKPIQQTHELSFAISNSSRTEIRVTSLTIDNTVFYLPDDRPFALAPSSQRVVNVRFAPAVTGFQSGVLAIATTDTNRPSINVPLTGVGAAITAVAPPQVVFSDSFRNRISRTPCALGAADLSLGGQGNYRYLPLMSQSANFLIGDGAITYAGTGDAGFSFSTRNDVCTSGASASPIGPNVIIKADFLLPAGTQAGPMFLTRAWQAGDPIFASVNSGFWVQLHASGEVRIRRIDSRDVVAASRPVTGYDSTRFHTLEASVVSGAMSVKLDGVVVAFIDGARTVNSVVLPATGGTNSGTAGMAFSAEPGGTASGQRMRDMVISVPGNGLSNTPNDRAIIEVTPNAVVSFDSTRVGSSIGKQLTIRNAGLLPLTINAVRFSPAGEFNVTSPSLPVTIEPNQTRNITITFSPIQSGSRMADMSILSNDPRRPEAVFTVIGSAFAVAGTVVERELALDDGTMDRAGRVSREAWVMNRITPPRYPAVLKKLRIYIPPDSIQRGEQITILGNRETANISRPTEPIPAGSFKSLASYIIPGNGRFVEVELTASQRITLTSGDFYVGFHTQEVRDGGAIAIDNSSTNQDRSWISFDSLNFVTPRSVENLGPGNFMIRAIVEVPAQ